jgi:hypothetical protein
MTLFSAAFRATVMPALGGLLLLACSGLSFAQTYDQSGPWWARLPRPLLGMAYSAEPSDYASAPGRTNPDNDCPDKPFKCKYFDDDFTNADFPLLWGASGGRNDLGTIQNSLHMNFLHLYNFSTCRNHVPFLDYAKTLGISVMIPISNYYVNPVVPKRAEGIQELFREIYGLASDGTGRKTPHPAAALWDIGNEFDISKRLTDGTTPLTAADVVSATKIILDYENLLGIADADKLLFTSPVSFGTFGEPDAPGIVKLEELKRAFKDAGLEKIWYTRFIASVNPFNDGKFMTNYLQNTYPSRMSSNGTTLPLFFAEFGENAISACNKLKAEGGVTSCSTTAEQNAAEVTYETEQINAVLPLAKTGGYFYGLAIFQWQNQFFLTGTEANFGVVQQSSPPTGTGTIIGGVCGIPSNTFTYPVDPLLEKPNFSAIAGALQ